MKEAAGEANMTVITIVLIAVVLAVGTLIVNSLLTNTARKSACSSVGGTLAGTQCTFNTANGSQTRTVSRCQNGRNYWVIDRSECDQQ